MREKIIYFLTIIITLFIGITGTILVIEYIPGGETTYKTVQEVSVTETNTIKSAVDKIYDAVVYIESYQNGKSIGSGTGFVYKKEDKNSYVITNNHVIDGATDVKITNNAGATVDAKVLGSDEYADIAVLSISTDAVLAVAKIGDSTALELGDTLFTVGSPLGIDYMGTVTKGILSGKDRTVEVSLSNGEFLMEVIQTDAAINPGNSGGPLCNINGEVIGVNSLKLVKDEIEGMGFAIPIEMVMATVDKLEKGEEVQRPLLGVSMLGIDETFSLYRNGIIIPEDVENGIVVVSVENDSPASISGLQKGDILLEVDSEKITSIGHFRFLLYKHSVGDTMKLKYYRDGKIKDVEVNLTKSIE